MHLKNAHAWLSAGEQEALSFLSRLFMGAADKPLQERVERTALREKGPGKL